VNGYGAWAIPNSTPPARFGYTGQAYLSELGMVQPNGNGKWFLDGRGRGELDRQDYPQDSRRTGIGPGGNSAGGWLQGVFGGRNYDINFYGSQQILMTGRP
jgi:hypothetical protein